MIRIHVIYFKLPTFKPRNLFNMCIFKIIYRYLCQYTTIIS